MKKCRKEIGLKILEIVFIEVFLFIDIVVFLDGFCVFFLVLMKVVFKRW